MKSKQPLTPLHSLSRRYPVVTYILLAFTFSYVGLFLPLQLPVPLKALHPLAKVYLPLILVVTGPGLAAILMQYLLVGRAGIKVLLHSLQPRQSHLLHWFAIPISTLALSLAAFVLAGLPLDVLHTTLAENWHLLILHYLLQIGLVGIGEELGWRGWLLPRLKQGRSLGAATALVFMVWSLWHFPKLLAPLPFSLPLLVLSLALSVLLSYLWYRFGQNTLLVAMAHGAVNAPIFFLESQLSGHQPMADIFLYGWQILPFAYITFAAVLVAFTWRDWVAESTIAKNY